MLTKIIGLTAFVLLAAAKLCWLNVAVRSARLRHRGIGRGQRVWGKGWSPMNIPAFAFVYSDDHRAFNSPSITATVWMLRLLIPAIAACSSAFVWLVFTHSS
jgi:hypothetical protein